MDKKELAKFIGNKIRYYRTKLNLTQDQLGEKLNTKKATISNYETGYRTPKQDDLFEIAHILNISIDDLFPTRNNKKNDITSIYSKLTPPRQRNGDSMEPLFKNGQIIFIEKSHTIKDGQIGVFIINGDAYVKKVYVEDNRLTLVSLNKKYKDLHFYDNESVRLVGKVIL